MPFYHWRILQDGVGCIAMAIKPTANLLEGLHASPATQSTQSTQSTKTNPSKRKTGKILKPILPRTKLLLQELHPREKCMFEAPVECLMSDETCGNVSWAGRVFDTVNVISQHTEMWALHLKIFQVRITSCHILPWCLSACWLSELKT